MGQLTILIIKYSKLKIKENILYHFVENQILYKLVSLFYEISQEKIVLTKYGKTPKNNDHEIFVVEILHECKKSFNISLKQRKEDRTQKSIVKCVLNQNLPFNLPFNKKKKKISHQTLLSIKINQRNKLIFFFFISCHLKCSLLLYKLTFKRKHRILDLLIETLTGLSKIAL